MQQEHIKESPVKKKLPAVVHNFFADDCEEPICGGNGTGLSNEIGGPYAQARSFEPRADALLQPAEDGALMASYSVFVVEPGAPVGKRIISLSKLSDFQFA